MHVPVLLHEAIDGLDPKRGETVVDATLGGAGHARELLSRIGPSGTLVAIDEDEEAIARAEKVLGRARLVHGNFRELEKHLAAQGISAVDRVLFDLGVSSYHYVSGRGFSFRKDEPLLMTLGKTPAKGFSAYEVVNEWEEGNLRDIIRAYGEERSAAKIAKAIVAARPVKTSGELAAAIEAAVPRRGKTHPATRTFQAIRMAVNDELMALKEGLDAAARALRPGGRLAVISFHSGEDRIVKHFFKARAAEGTLAVLTKRPLVPSREEELKNPRSRSAKLRIAEKRDIKK